MEKFNLKKHNKKMMDFTKNAAGGIYPSVRVAKAGSYVGLVVGLVLSVAGVIGILNETVWGYGSLFAGVVTVLSNVFNLKRIKNKN